jgi:hypothetical protein
VEERCGPDSDGISSSSSSSSSSSACSNKASVFQLTGARVVVGGEVGDAPPLDTAPPPQQQVVVVVWGGGSLGHSYTKLQTANRKPQTANRKPQTANRKAFDMCPPGWPHENKARPRPSHALHELQVRHSLALRVQPNACKCVTFWGRAATRFCGGAARGCR